ncbi:MAG: SPOR domain-containing protein [Pedobacter sp.]
MDFKLGKDPENSSNQAVNASKGNQNGLLIVLLVLVAGFAYVYFFTGMIKPLKVQKPAETQAPQVVKKSIPSRDGNPVKTNAIAVPEMKKEATVPVTGNVEPPKVAQASPEPAPAVKEAARLKEQGKKSEPSKPEVKKPMPVPAEKPTTAKDGDKKTALVDKKQPVTVKVKDAPAKKAANKDKTDGSEVKAKTVAKSEKKSVAGTGQVHNGRWTVMVGSYLLEDALAIDLVKVRKAGLEATVLPGARKKTPMIRLLLGEYGDRTAAKAELDKIRLHTSDAFIMDHGGKYAVYAGSYLLNEGALSEKGRLAAAGFPLTLKRAEVDIASKTLTAGTFSDKKSAESVLKKLKGAGVKASLSQQ